MTSFLTSSIFLFLYFLFSFITFDLKLQIKSNKFVKICKISISQHRLLGTIFGQNKITKIPFWSNLPYMAIWEISKLRFINIPKYLNKNQRDKVSNIIQNDNSFSYLKIV